MRLLLDTHAFLWFVWDHPRLSTMARSLMTSSTNELLLSAGSLWENAIKTSLGKLTLAVPFEEFVGRALVENEIVLLPVSISRATGVVRLPFHHRDPFDRLLAAQALAEDVPPLSTDDVFDSHGVARLW